MPGLAEATSSGASANTIAKPPDKNHESTIPEAYNSTYAARWKSMWLEVKITKLSEDRPQKCE
jgi:hypothetical protein